MANRFPLIVNPDTKEIQELKLNDNLDLTGNGIYANGSLGSNGQVLTSNGSTVEWRIETDNLFTASPAGSITETNKTNWDTAYSWGDHASVGYLTSYTETDPVFSASEAASITSTDTSNWDTAYSWGNHASAGYLTSYTYTETDPVFSASPAGSITETNKTNWNTAYGWGNHASVGYLTSYTETDPVFSASPAGSITETNKTNWNTAYGWGNHSTQGYLKSGDPINLIKVTETVVNNFSTSLTPASGTLTIDASLGTVVLGNLSASVTTWAFTNVSTANSKATTITVIIDGDTTETYGDACSVNGSAVTGGIRWSGGSAPTPTVNFDIISFTIIKDSAGTINVFGSDNTNFS